MFAVIRTGGKQYKVSEDEKIVVEKLEGAPGATVELRDVLMIDDGKAPRVGTPVLDQAAVFAEIIEQSRADKIIVFKKNRRKGYRRRKGHRQEQTVLRIVGISPDGKKPAAKKAAVKKAAPALAKDKEKAAPAPAKDEAKAEAKATKPKAEAAPKKAAAAKVKDKAPAKKAAPKKAAAKKPAADKSAAKKAAKPKSKSKE